MVKLKHKEYLNPHDLSRMYDIKVLSVYRWLKGSPKILERTESGIHNTYRVHRDLVHHFEHLVDLRKSNPSVLVNTIIELEDENSKLKRLLKL